MGFNLLFGLFLLPVGGVKPFTTSSDQNWTQTTHHGTLAGYKTIVQETFNKVVAGVYQSIKTENRQFLY